MVSAIFSIKHNVLKLWILLVCKAGIRIEVSVSVIVQTHKFTHGEQKIPYDAINTTFNPMLETELSHLACSGLS